MNEDARFEYESVIGVPSTNLNGRQFDRTLIGSYVVIPKSYVPTLFELTRQEWHDTKKMIDIIKQYLDKKYKHDGYNIGWNVGSIAGQTAHLHPKKKPTRGFFCFTSTLYLYLLLPGNYEHQPEKYLGMYH